MQLRGHQGGLSLRDKAGTENKKECSQSHAGKFENLIIEEKYQENLLNIFKCMCMLRNTAQFRT